MPITASTAQIAALPTTIGTTNLALVSGSQPTNITGASPVGPAISITSQSLGIHLVPTGTLDNAATVELQAQINGSTFLPVYINGTKKTWTGTNINLASGGGSTGLYEQVPIKANQIRFVLIPGTTTGVNGVITRVMD